MRLTRDAIHALASEYVAGTLRGGARRRFEALARDDREVREVLERWEALLTPLAQNVPAVEPPARVWRSIESRIGARGAAAAPEPGLGFWRSVGLLASGLAAILVVAFLWTAPGHDADPAFVAVLTSADSAPRMVVSLHSDRQLRVRVVKPWTNVDGKSLELWALPKNGAPRSLGLVANERDTEIRLAPADARLFAANALAVSLEPRGGSATGAPTGPVLCSGAIAATRKT